MTVRGNAIVTDVTVSTLPSAPLWALEIWSNPDAVAMRFAAATGFALPKILEMDGALTAIGGGITRVLLSGKGWRRLLMEGGVFDAESPTFAAGCSASTIIDHVNIRLHVLREDACLAYVPLSYTEGIVHFWQEAAKAL
jgi:heterotetrameric sarcosine oxidase gamma subunit